MRPTLRLVIGLLCVAVVIVVASVTLAITYNVSLTTVRDVGKQYSAALAKSARDRTFEYFDAPSRHLDVIGDMAVGGEYDLPSAMPDQTLDLPKNRVLDLFWTLSRCVNFSYSNLGIIFDDGSGCSIYDVRNQSHVTGVCRFTMDWPRSGDQSVLMTNWHFGNGTRDPDYFYNNSENLDARFAAYYTAKLLVGGISRGLWFPVTLLFLSHEFRFIWPAARPLFNTTGGFIGLATATRRLDTISLYLESVKGTPDTEVFAVQSDGYLLASTHSSQFYTFERVPPSTPVGDGCASSGDAAWVGTNEVTMGCRSNARTFSAYPPLQKAAEDRGFLATSGTEVKLLKADGDSYFVASTAVSNSYRYFGLNIVLCMPEADVLGDIVTGRNLAIGVSVGVAVAVAAIAFALSYVLLQPLSDVSRKMLETAKLREPDGNIEFSSLAEIHDLQRAYTNMNTAINSFTRYVPRDVVKDLMATGQLCTIQMTPMRCSMLFVDIAGFTTICERVPPEVLSALVSEYFDIASRIVMQHDGLIDKFIGDCVMAVWGAPFAVSNHEVKATLTALMLDRETLLPPLAEIWDEAGELLRVRVGVSTGEVLAGNMGSSERMNYTVIGDPVNLAARLESLNKQFDTRVMVSEMTAECLLDVFVLRLLMPIAVVGKDKPVKVYEVLGLAGTLTPDDAMRLETGDYGADVDSQSNSDIMSQSLNSSTGGSSTRRYRKSKASTTSMVQDAAVKTIKTGVPAVATADDVSFARLHTEAVLAYVRGEFGAAVSTFDKVLALPLLASGDGPKSPTSPTANPWMRRPERSVHLVRDLSEQYLREGTPANFNGVFRALEK